MKYVFTIFFFLIIQCISAQILVKGKLINNNKKEPILATYVNIKNLLNNFYISSMALKDDGSFLFILKDTGDYVITIVDYSINNSYTYRFTKDTTIFINYDYHCIYDSTIKNNRCPICHHKKDVIPILYGLLINSKKKTSNKTEDKYYPGGCNISYCQPHWYCKNDKYKF